MSVAQAVRAARAGLGPWLVLALACGPTTDLDDGTGSGDATSTATTIHGVESSTSGSTTIDVGTTTATTIDPDSTSGSGSDETSGGTVVCPVVEGSTCASPISCDGFACGGANSPFDEYGCMRSLCEGPEDCGEGELCHAPIDWGGCAGSGMSCVEDDELGCSCVSKPDCGGRFCVPEELVPPADCSALMDEPSCTAAGCGPFVTGRPITDAGGGACLCDLPVDLCIYVPPGAESTPEPTLYLAPDLGSVIKLGSSFDPAPFGWIPCADVPEQPLCQCAAMLPCDV